MTTSRITNINSVHHSEVIDAISDRRRKYEIGAAMLTAIGKFIFMDYLDWKLFYVLLVVCGWTIYIIYRYNKVDGILRYWGFRTDNLKSVSLKILPFGIVSIIASIVVGFYIGTINITWHILPILIMYPFWATIQQFLLIGLVAGNLQDYKGTRLKENTIILSTSILFGVIHFPSLWLVLGTFILALFYVYIFLKSRNIFILGVLQGWIGSVFFYSIVGRDPFVEAFGIYLP